MLDDEIIKPLTYRERLLYKQAYNDAIEAAANDLRMNTTGTWPDEYLKSIRRLKKNA